MASKKTGEYNLNQKEMAFCQYYVSEEFFCSGVKSYQQAYECDYNTAKANASRLLTNVNILNYIDSLLDDMGLNDQRVDKELAKLILQDDEKPVKLNAIKEYNKLKQRIEERINNLNTNVQVEELDEKQKSKIFSRLKKLYDKGDE